MVLCCHGYFVVVDASVAAASVVVAVAAAADVASCSWLEIRIQKVASQMCLLSRTLAAALEALEMEIEMTSLLLLLLRDYFVVWTANL